MTLYWKALLTAFAKTPQPPAVDPEVFEQFLKHPCLRTLRHWVAMDLEGAFNIVKDMGSSRESVLQAQGAISKLEWILNDEQLRSVCASEVKDEALTERWQKIAAHIAAIEKELNNAGNK